MAKDAITGMWKWIKTYYPNRGGNESIETPLSVNKEKTFEFLDDELRVFEDKVLVYETSYEIKYWGEGTNTVDELLMISFSEQDPGGYGGANVLFLSASSTCMRLVNSYKAGGGDLFLSREINKLLVIFWTKKSLQIDDLQALVPRAGVEPARS